MNPSDYFKISNQAIDFLEGIFKMAELEEEDQVFDLVEGDLDFFLKSSFINTARLLYKILIELISIEVKKITNSEKEIPLRFYLVLPSEDNSDEKYQVIDEIEDIKAVTYQKLKKIFEKDEKARLRLLIIPDTLTLGKKYFIRKLEPECRTATIINSSEQTFEVNVPTQRFFLALELTRSGLKLCSYNVKQKILKRIKSTLEMQIQFCEMKEKIVLGLVTQNGKFLKQTRRIDLLEILRTKFEADNLNSNKKKQGEFSRSFADSFDYEAESGGITLLIDKVMELSTFEKLESGLDSSLQLYNSSSIIFNTLTGIISFIKNCKISSKYNFKSKKVNFYF